MSFSTEMTKSWLSDHCKRTGGYRQPALNDQLLLHCKGFTLIQNLEEYVNCKCIWLEQNAISEIEGLENLVELRTLFLHQNCIHEITGLSTLQHLCTLNLSNNWITDIEGLEGLHELETLQISHNRLSCVKSIERVLDLPKLECLDISHNKITPKGDEQPEVIVEFCKKLKTVSCLYLNGNPIVGQIKQYRKKMVLAMDELKYLDEKPVFDSEKRLTSAWGRGGFDEEQRERVLMAEEKKQEMKRDCERWREMQEKGRPLKEKREKEWLEKMELKKIEDEKIRQQRIQDQQLFIRNEEVEREKVDVEEYKTTTELMKFHTQLNGVVKSLLRDRQVIEEAEEKARKGHDHLQLKEWSEIEEQAAAVRPLMLEDM